MKKLANPLTPYVGNPTFRYWMRVACTRLVSQDMLDLAFREMESIIAKTPRPRGRKRK